MTFWSFTGRTRYYSAWIHVIWINSPQSCAWQQRRSELRQGYKYTVNKCDNIVFKKKLLFNAYNEKNHSPHMITLKCYCLSEIYTCISAPINEMCGFCYRMAHCYWTTRGHSLPTASFTRYWSGCRVHFSSSCCLTTSFPFEKEPQTQGSRRQRCLGHDW